MGINSNGVKFLVQALAAGVDYTKTMMIGRQNLYINPKSLQSVLATCGRKLSINESAGICEASSGFSEGLFLWLGAKEVESIDYSSYQDATYVHDMNNPIPDHLKCQYSAVLDGGSLEHIFNFPVAIKNCMEMVKVGGHYLAITPANNFLGHGFYQFSPELYFTVFAEENGFKIESMIAFEDIKKPTWYKVSGPRDVRDRVVLCNSEPVYLLIIAKRIQESKIFATSPQQSDYMAIWDGSEGNPLADPQARIATPSLFIRIVKFIVPSRVRRLTRFILKSNPRTSLRKGFDPKFFQPISPPFQLKLKK